MVVANSEVRSAERLAMVKYPQDSAQTGLTANDHVLEAFPPNRTNDPLDERTLPRRSWRSQYFLNAKVFHLPGQT
jgi:hypothetical protein